MSEPRMQRSDVETLVAFGIELAAGACEAICAIRNRRSLRVKSSPTDYVTAADVASDDAIRRRLTRRRPLDGLVSEDGDGIEARNGVRWVVDPLDGTVNFRHGLPNFAVSVACETHVEGRWQAVAGVVHDVTREERYSAGRGMGSRLDDIPIAVTNPVHAAEALVGTGFGYAASDRRRQAATVARVAPLVADIRSTGSTVIDLCWTAAGRLDACFEDELSRWDWAAGRLIVEEAGGRVTDYGRGVLAGGPHLHSELCRLLS
ncbi:inositol monophosphatase [Dactylosporangium roseum]|uniref:Inositol-1-monophosphatase n=1 Tax=Dactylosporangium roseum TaxID=47989 RepID=A0ABY5ZD10_9ACTN|nr:inositol monophosphatase family protein [Dactylosporangium roseum]UWZ39307.1 inositol monophosphatase [Dactylosporangium roseum]